MPSVGPFEDFLRTKASSLIRAAIDDHKKSDKLKNAMDKVYYTHELSENTMDKVKVLI